VAHPIERVISKLNRGEELLHEVKHEVDAFFLEPFFDPAIETDRQGRAVVRVVNVREPPPKLSLRIGECVYAYRSALDHLAYRLAVAHSGDPLPHKIEETSMFPIAESGPKFRGKGFRIAGMSPRARKLVEQMQPYHRHTLPEAWALLALDQLNNVDKHRDLHPTGSVLAGTQFQISGSGFRELRKIEAWPRELRERAMLARFTGVFDGDVEFSMPNARFDVVFGSDSAARAVRGRSVLVTLVDVRDFIAKRLMPAFAEELGVELAFVETPPGP
jgi:hypothetical protein